LRRRERKGEREKEEKRERVGEAGAGGGGREEEKRRGAHARERERERETSELYSRFPLGKTSRNLIFNKSFNEYLIIFQELFSIVIICFGFTSERLLL
jgi:hypothetical protein